eukprot:CAMPEP_0168315882 /NCGR_PEP_ID=MMETSP0210-20121227/13163_1 /TAXON_ID=40633 /ORGANISM="Condylostoma magnum, Strain COL2" /LENGTH=45 /DNA_ID= /DNA_START= /DNA_END= /DNA_ORIENTATION=
MQSDTGSNIVEEYYNIIPDSQCRDSNDSENEEELKTPEGKLTDEE